MAGKWDSFFQGCIYFCILLIAVTAFTNVVAEMGVFPISIAGGYQFGNDTNESFEGVTNIEMGEYRGMDAVWAVVLGGSIIAGLAVAWITHSTSIIGVFIFSGVFWSSYLRVVSILYVGGYFNSIAPFIVAGTLVFSFFWAAAVAGMLSGSG